MVAYVWGGAAVAIYSEYSVSATLVPVVVGMTFVLPPPRWRTLGLGVLPAMSFVPWAHQFSRSLDHLNGPRRASAKRA